MSGILLRRLGHNVQILERAATCEREGLAAGLGVTLQLKRFFDLHDRLGTIPMGVSNDNITVLDHELNVIEALPMVYNMTTWDTAYYRLRANFDGMSSTYCPDPPSPPPESQGAGVVSIGKRVTEILDINGQICVRAEDVHTGKLTRIEGDLIIVADGANSLLREQLCPGLQREEPGYVIWRGTVETSELPQAVLERFENRCVLTVAHYSYCFMYTILGVNGTLEAGKRHINIAWYFWPTTFPIQDIMTDVEGKYHRSTVSKGKLNPAIWDAQVGTARKIFPSAVSTIIERIKYPFVSIISSVAAPRAAFFDNRVFLVGDALTQVQPNSGMGGNMAANAVMSLAEVIGPVGKGLPKAEEIRQWEKNILELTQLTRVRSAAFGSWYLSSWLGIAWYFARLTVLWWQRYFGARRKGFVLFQD